MELTAQEYQKLSALASPRSPAVSDCIKAFLVGGSICVIGQLITFGGQALGLDKETASLLCTTALIFLSAILTAFSVYDKIAKHAGAGTLVPITGFANSVAAPAVEFKSEGFILGVGANMFKIAGPVILYGTAASVVYGVIYWVIRMI